MKVILVVLALVVACVVAEDWTVKDKEQRKQIRSECFKQNNVTAEQKKQILKGELPNEEPVRKFILCNALKHGIFTTDEGFITDRVVKELKLGKKEREATEMVKGCIDPYKKHDKEDLEVVYEVFLCLKKVSSELKVVAEDWTVKDKEQRKQISSECLKQNNVTAEQKKQILKGELPNEEPVRKFILCNALKHGIFTTDEGFIIDRVVKELKPGKKEREATELVKGCIDPYKKHDKEDLEVVYEVFLCLKKVSTALKIVAEDWTVKDKEQRKQISSECFKQNNVTAEQKKQILKGELPNEEPVRKFILCNALKHGIFTTDEGFITDRVVKELKPGKKEREVTELVKGCIEPYKKHDKKDLGVIYEVFLCLKNVSADLKEDWTVKNEEQRKQINIDCAKKHHLSKKQMKKMKSGEFPNEEQVRKFLLCKALKHDIFQAGKEFRIDRIVKQFNPGVEEEKATKLVEGCVQKHKDGNKGDDEVLYGVYLCLKKVESNFKAATKERKINIKCAKKHHLSSEQVKTMENGELPDEQPIHDFLLCKAQRLGIFKTGMDKELARKIVQYCIETGHTDDEEDAESIDKVYICLKQTASAFPSRGYVEVISVTVEETIEF